MWDGGLAHRDLKPSNLLARRGEVVAIDVFFCQVHPSPWRQSVDLANMLLTLALRSDQATVDRIALERFTPDEIAEAFAASRSVTIPTQLRHLVRMQRWTARRPALTGAILAGAAVTVTFAVMSLQPAGFRP